MNTNQARISGLSKAKTKPGPKPNAKELAHGPIEELTENLWRVSGDLPHFGLHRVMTVAKSERRVGGKNELVIHSAIMMNEESMQKLEAWGTPRYLLIPHSRHRLDAPKYKERYPWLYVLATKHAVEKAREVVHVDGTYDDFPLDKTIRLEMLDGMRESEGAMIVRSNDGVTIVLNEVVFDIPQPKSGIMRLLLKGTKMGPGPRVTPVVKWELVHDRDALRAHLERLATTPDLVRLIVSHEKMRVGDDAIEALHRAAATL